MEEALDLKEIFQILLRRLKWIVLASFGGLLLLFLVSQFVIPPKYTSSISLYVNNTAESAMLSAVNINDINASQKLVNTYIVILQDDEVLQQVADQLTTEYTIDSLERILPFSKVNGEKVLKTDTLRKIIKMSSVNNTEVLKIEAETRSSTLSARICTIMTEIAPDVLSRVVKAGSVEVIGEAKPADKPSFPNVKLNSVIGFLLGAVLSVLFVLLLSMMDNRVAGEEELKKRYNIPILGEIPDFDINFSEGYKTYGK